MEATYDSPVPAGCDPLRKSDRDPRFYARILSKPFHKYRFLSLRADGSCQPDVLDRLTGAKFAPDEDTLRYLLDTRDAARGAIVGLVGQAGFDALAKGTQEAQGAAIVRLLTENAAVRSAFQQAGFQRRNIRQDSLREAKYEVEPAAVLAALEVTGRSPPIVTGTVEALTRLHLDAYSAALAAINARVAPVPGDGRLAVAQHRLLTLERTKLEEAFHLAIEVVVHRKRSPYGFHLRLMCVTVGTAVVEVYRAEAVGQVMSDAILLQPRDPEVPEFSWYFMGADDVTFKISRP